MRIAQLILPGTSQYERKSQRLDAAQLAAAGHDVLLVNDPSGFDLAHLYGPLILPRRRLTVPYLASGMMRRGWWQPPVPQPRFVVTPIERQGSTLLGSTLLPEAVDEAFFMACEAIGPRLVVGTFVRPSVKNVIELTMHRLALTRDDITWHLFDTPPEPEELREVGLWIDAATEPDDYDGCTAEALAAGLPVVASRTPINLQRTEKGRTALLVPVSDPNELTHAI